MTDSLPRILIADDNPDIRMIVREALADLEVELTEAFDGPSTLEAILEQRPNLVVLDVMMPGMSGWEIARYVRSHDELTDVRLLMLTAVGQTVNAMTSPLYGADSYLDKPFDLDTLAGRVEELLAKGAEAADS